MRFVVVIGFKTSGEAEVLDCSTLPKASPDSVTRAFHVMRVEGSVPAGFVAAKLLDSERGQTGLAYPRPGAVSEPEKKGKSK